LKILSIDAKDLYNTQDYNIRKADGSFNFKRFNATYDNSLD